MEAKENQAQTSGHQDPSSGNRRPEPAKRGGADNRDAPQGAQRPDKFEFDVQAARVRARENIDAGVITAAYGANREEVLRMLNEALATELVCVLRYKRHYFMASGIHADPVAAEFAEHATQEQDHADRIAARIIELGGKPDFNPVTIAQRSHSEYVEGENLKDMIRENLVAERIAIDSYKRMVDYIDDGDPTTRRLLEDVLAVEEEHAHDMADFLEAG